MKTRTYSNILEGMEPLRTFPPEVFFEDADASQRLCDFILSLAVVYNDVRDLWINRILLLEVKPEHAGPPTPHWGEYSGRLVREARVMAGVLNELFALIRKNRKALDESPFQKAVGRATPEAQADWREIVDAALGASSLEVGSLGWSLRRLRNKVGFHYDAKVLGASYRERFGGATGDMVPFISMGANLKSTRYYFGDAACEQFLLGPADNAKARDAVLDPRILLEKVATALYAIVGHFISLRSELALWKG